MDAPDSGVGGRRLAIRVTPDAERQLRGGHPWLYDASITSAPPDGRPGDLAVVFDARRRFLAIGLYDPASPIRVKVLHHGRPATIDATWWRDRVADARRLRAPLEADDATTGYRCVNGENDGLPGVVLDRYADTFVLKLYGEAWFAHLDALVDAVVAVWAPPRLVLRWSRSARAEAPIADGTTLVGAAPIAPVRFRENGLVFEADVVSGQKTGFFLDQRDNRARVRDRSVGRRVLDVFSFNGGFSVSAAAGGATLVHSVDISPVAIAAVGRHLALNAELASVRACRHEASVGDATEVMAALRDAGRRFDVVVVDPPSFASRREQVPGALRAYGRLTELAVALLEPGGTLVQASCTSRVSGDDLERVVTDAAARAGARLRAVTRTGHAVDHPVTFAEGHYLDAVFATVEPRR